MKRFKSLDEASSHCRFINELKIKSFEYNFTEPEWTPATILIKSIVDKLRSQVVELRFENCDEQVACVVKILDDITVKIYSINT